MTADDLAEYEQALALVYEGLRAMTDWHARHGHPGARFHLELTVVLAELDSQPAAAHGAR
jgi:hypothetical protein